MNFNDEDLSVTFETEALMDPDLHFQLVALFHLFLDADII